MQLENLQLLVGQPTTKATQGSSVCFLLVFLLPFWAYSLVWCAYHALTKVKGKTLLFNHSNLCRLAPFGFASTVWLKWKERFMVTDSQHPQNLFWYMYIFFSSKILFDLVRFLFNLGCRTACTTCPGPAAWTRTLNCRQHTDTKCVSWLPLRLVVAFCFRMFCHRVTQCLDQTHSIFAWPSLFLRWRNICCCALKRSPYTLGYMVWLPLLGRCRAKKGQNW